VARAQIGLTLKGLDSKTILKYMVHNSKPKYHHLASILVCSTHKVSSSSINFYSVLCEFNQAADWWVNYGSSLTGGELVVNGT